MITIEGTMNRPRTLSAVFVRKVSTPGRFGDGRGGYGLSLLVKRRKNGRIAKTWSQRLRIRGKPFNVGLGSFPIVTLAEARATALENARAVHRGEDPRRRQSRMPTFEQAAGKVHALHAPTWRSARTAVQRWSLMESYAIPLIGDKTIDAITGADVIGVLTPVWTSKPETGRKLRQQIAAIMKHAIAEGWRTDDPAGPALSAALPKNRTAPKRHHRALHHRDVASAVAIVRETGARPATKLLMEFIIVTAVRSGEARLAIWGEIDSESATWTIPGERTKTGKPHRVPLADRAVAILRDAQKLSGGSGLMFPSPRGKALSNMSTSKMLKDAGINCTTHGFRSSFRSWCADQDESRELAEMALGHALPGIEGSYMRSDLFERRRALMERWAAYIATTPGPKG